MTRPLRDPGIFNQFLHVFFSRVLSDFRFGQAAIWAPRPRSPGGDSNRLEPTMTTMMITTMTTMMSVATMMTITTMMTMMMTIVTMNTISTMMTIVFVRKLKVVHKQVGGCLISYNLQLACVRELEVI